MTLALIDTGGRAPAPLVGPSTGSGIAPDRIYALYIERKMKNRAVLAAGERIKRVYNGDWSTALPELEKNEKTQVANLVNQGVEQDALRVSSTMPNVLFPPERNSAPARARAMDRKMVVQGWHYENRMPLKFRRRARHLLSYATSPVYLRPGPDMVPVWEVWDPLSTFPSQSAPDDFCPHDVIYHFKRSWQWLQDTYNLRGRLPLTKNMQTDTMIECLLYCDPDELVMIAVGKDGDGANMPATLLQRVPNLANRCTVVIPGRITLDRLQGMFDQMIGMYEAQGLVWAMHLQAIKRSIFPETWLTPNAPGVDPNVIVAADAMRGVIGKISDGNVTTYRADPSQMTGQTLDRMERNMRQTGGIPAEYGGESGSNIRTARRGTQVLSSQVDFPIQETQDILAASLEEENKAAIAIAKAYWPNTEKTLYVPFGDGQVTYTPAAMFPFDTHSVKYAYSGVSADGLVVEILQRVGAGTMSDEHAMEIDPLIDDPQLEKSRIVSEQIEKALLSSIQQQAASPESPYSPADMAWLLSQLRDKKLDIATAILALDERVKKAQEANAQGQLQGQAGQPGLAMPGAPGTPQAGIPAQGPQPTPDQQGLAALMSSLRTNQRGVPAQSQQLPTPVPG